MTFEEFLKIFNKKFFEDYVEGIRKEDDNNFVLTISHYDRDIDQTDTVDLYLFEDGSSSIYIRNEENNQIDDHLVVLKETILAIQYFTDTWQISREEDKEEDDE